MPTLFPSILSDLSANGWKIHPREERRQFKILNFLIGYNDKTFWNRLHYHVSCICIISRAPSGLGHYKAGQKCLLINLATGLVFYSVLSELQSWNTLRSLIIFLKAINLSKYRLNLPGVFGPVKSVFTGNLSQFDTFFSLCAYFIEDGVENRKLSLKF